MSGVSSFGNRSGRFTPSKRALAPDSTGSSLVRQPGEHTHPQVLGCWQALLQVRKPDTQHRHLYIPRNLVIIQSNHRCWSKTGQRLTRGSRAGDVQGTPFTNTNALIPSTAAVAPPAFRSCSERGTEALRQPHCADAWLQVRYCRGLAGSVLEENACDAGQLHSIILAASE